MNKSDIYSLIDEIEAKYLEHNKDHDITDPITEPNRIKALIWNLLTEYRDKISYKQYCDILDYWFEMMEIDGTEKTKQDLNKLKP